MKLDRNTCLECLSSPNAAKRDEFNKICAAKAEKSTKHITGDNVYINFHNKQDRIENFVHDINPTFDWLDKNHEYFYDDTPPDLPDFVDTATGKKYEVKYASNETEAKGIIRGNCNFHNANYCIICLPWERGNNYLILNLETYTIEQARIDYTAYKKTWIRYK